MSKFDTFFSFCKFWEFLILVQKHYALARYALQ